MVLPPAERISRLVAQQTTFTGPVPHPELFRKYGEVVPDAPDRILKQFELDSGHAREIADKAIEAQKADIRRAQWMAWSLVMAGFVASTVLAIFNQPWVAGVIAGTTLMGVLTAYLGRDSSSTNKE